MDKRISPEVPLEPGGIRVLGLLVDREGDCSHHSNACQRCRNASKETSESLSSIGITNA
jgi:hypothetical protein